MRLVDKLLHVHTLYPNKIFPFIVIIIIIIYVLYFFFFFILLLDDNKTGPFLSSLPCCYESPLRVTTEEMFHHLPLQ